MFINYRPPFCVRKCLKFLISVDLIFFIKNIIYNISRLIYYYNNRLPYRIRKVVGNIYKYSRSWGEKIMRWRWTCRDYMKWIEIWGRMGVPDGARGLVIGYEYKKWENMRCFGNQ